jgi:hypothetical protein
MEDRTYMVQVNIEVPPSSESPEQTTEASKALGESLLECAEEYKHRMPEQLFIELNNLAKVNHECVPYEAWRRRNTALHQMAAEFHVERERVGILKEHLAAMRELADKNRQLFDVSQKHVDLVQERLGHAQEQNNTLVEKLKAIITMCKDAGEWDESKAGVQTRYRLRQGVSGKRKR